MGTLVRVILRYSTPTCMGGLEPMGGGPDMGGGADGGGADD